MGIMPMEEGAEDMLMDEMLKQRVEHAIFLAASTLDDESLAERSIERLEIAQRAHIQVILNAHEEAGQALRSEVEDTLSGLKDAERMFLSFATEVDEIANEVRT